MFGMKLRVGVVFGGPSVEHEVSVISALQAIQHMNQEKYDVVPIYISKNREWYCGSELKEISNYQDIPKLLQQLNPVNFVRIGNEFCLVRTTGLFRKVVDTVDVVFPIVHGQNVEDGSLVGFF